MSFLLFISKRLYLIINKKRKTKIVILKIKSSNCFAYDDKINKGNIHKIKLLK